MSQNWLIATLQMAYAFMFLYVHQAPTLKNHLT